MNFSSLLSEVDVCQVNQASKDSLNALIIYETQAAAMRARSVFNGLRDQFGFEIEIEWDLWRLDVLEISQAQNLAERSMQLADLIIVTTVENAQLSAAIKAWLIKCIARKTPGSAALVGLFEPEDELTPHEFEMRRFLQPLAENVGLTFLAPSGRGQDRFDLEGRSSGKKRPFLNLSKELSVWHRPSSRWGINE